MTSVPEYTGHLQKQVMMVKIVMIVKEVVVQLKRGSTIMKPDFYTVTMFPLNSIKL